MRNLNVLLIISSVVANAKSVGDRENGFDRKRFDLGLETCMENFDVHVDKIIRTQDSRAMGAKYLNEAELPTRDDCMKMCCETPLCDVFVYEQKVPGSCYLFHCGSPEDFKCKFTQHRNYTSAVLAFNNRFGELNNRMKLTKHEEELNMLRKLDASQDPTSTLPPSTKVPAVTVQSDSQNHNTKSQCSRYQFECKGSGECIAIYNACDGIPQCSDGSDEAPELDCPGISGSTHPKTFHDQLKSLKETSKNSSQLEKSAEPSSPTEASKQGKVQVPKSQAQQPQSVQSSPFSGYFPFGFSQQNEEAADGSRAKVELPPPSANQPKYNGREGEIVQYPLNNPQWQIYQPQHQDENRYGYGRKGSSLISENSDSQLPNPYNGNEMSRTDYAKYGGGSGGGGGGLSGNGYYGGSGPVYYPGPNTWIQRVPQNPPHGVEDGLQRPVMPMYGNGILGSVPSDYYYEDSQLRGRYGQVPQDLRRIYNPDMYRLNQNNPSPKEGEKSNSPAKEPKAVETSQSNPATDKKVESSKMTPVTTGSEGIEATTTKAPVKGEKPQQGTSAAAAVAASRVADRYKLTEGDMRNVDGVNERPSGAILSLTLGVCITAIMITLVGCRLRVVRRRMRRNGKSPYAHDADFLVNGMYL